MPESSRNFEDNIIKEDFLPLKERLTAFRVRHMNGTLPGMKKIAQRRLGDIIRPLHQILMMVKQEREPLLKALVEEIEAERKLHALDSTEAQILKIIIGQNYMDNEHMPNKLITEILNTGVPEKYRKSNAKVGRILDAMGFAKIRKADGVYIICDAEKIALMMNRFGVQPDSHSPPEKLHNLHDLHKPSICKEFPDVDKDEGLKTFSEPTPQKLNKMAPDEDCVGYEGSEVVNKESLD